MPFPGADESVVHRTQRYLYSNEQQRPIQFQAYIKSGTLGRSILTMFNGLTLFMMAKSECTRKYLLNNPKYWSGGYVTKEGPTDNVTNNSHFTFDLVGTGWEEGADVENTPPNKTVVAKVSVYSIQHYHHHKEASFWMCKCLPMRNFFSSSLESG